jgi:hypothetical protein
MNSLSSIWYGHGTSETINISLEHPPTWIALLYTVFSSRSYKKTRLSMLLDKNKKNIDPDIVVKTIFGYLAERKYQ